MGLVPWPCVLHPTAGVCVASDLLCLSLHLEAELVLHMRSDDHPLGDTGKVMRHFQRGEPLILQRLPGRMMGPDTTPMTVPSPRFC